MQLTKISMVPFERPALSAQRPAAQRPAAQRSTLQVPGWSQPPSTQPPSRPAAHEPDSTSARPPATCLGKSARVTENKISEIKIFNYFKILWITHSHIISAYPSHLYLNFNFTQKCKQRKRKLLEGRNTAACYIRSIGLR